MATLYFMCSTVLVLLTKVQVANPKGSQRDTMYQCDSSKIYNGNLLVDKISYKSGDTAKVICDKAYKLVGPEKILCTNKGWYEIPKCEITCPRQLPPKYGKINGDMQVIAGGTVEVVCLDGYEIDGDSILVCGNDSVWEHEEMPSCRKIEITCPRQLPPKYGKINGDMQVIAGGTVEVVCLDGYEIDGDSILVCGNDSVWEHEEMPSCRKIEITCPRQLPPKYGKINGDMQVIAGGTVEVVCLDGYEIDGDSILVCGNDSVWEHEEMPSCRKIGLEADCTTMNDIEPFLYTIIVFLVFNFLCLLFVIFSCLLIVKHVRQLSNDKKYTLENSGSSKKSMESQEESKPMIQREQPKMDKTTPIKNEIDSVQENEHCNTKESFHYTTQTRISIDTDRISSTSC